MQTDLLTNVKAKKGMIKDFEPMDFSQNYTYKDTKIYISFETKDYILCSFYESGKGKFKLDKSVFYAGH